MKSLSLVLLSILTFLWSAPGFSLVDGGNCHGLQCGQVGRLSLSSKGSAKLLKMGIDTTTEKLDLKDEANQALADKDFPYKFNLSGSKKNGIKAEIEKVHFDALKLGKSKVDIDEDELHVCVPVDEMDIKVDAALDIYGSKLTQKGASARVKKNAPQKPEVCFKGKLGADGEVEELVHVDADEPKDIATETKLAMLKMDLNKANDDEILFNYMTLYFMEDKMPLPTKMSWDNIKAVLGEINPQTVKNFFDVEKMRDELKRIKGGLPVAAFKEKQTGLKNYIGALDVDLNLKANKGDFKRDDKFWNEAYDLWVGKNEKPPKKKIKQDSQGLWGSITDMADNALENAKTMIRRSAYATARVVEGVATNTRFNTESILRERFLPYLQESFNKNATSSAPVMTAIAKAAEKKLIPLAKEKANRAIANFQKGVMKDGVYRKAIKEPVFNAQDLVDHNTLRRLETKIPFNRFFDLTKSANKEQMKNRVEKLLNDSQHYLHAISDDSSDKRALEFLTKTMSGSLQVLGNFLSGPHGAFLGDDLKNQYQSLKRLRRAKAAFLRQNIKERERDLNLQFSANFFNQISGGPEVNLAIPELCQDVGSLPPSKVLRPQDMRKHDINAAVSTDAINALIKRKTDHGEFDFCLYDNQARTCSNEGSNYDNKCKFNESPKLVWNPISKKHEIHLNKISCETRLLNADPQCGAQSNVDIPILGFIINTTTKAAGSLCKFIGDQTDDFVQGSVGENLVDVVVEVEPKVCGNSVCMEPKLKDTGVMHDLQKINPSLAGIVGKVVGTVASPITDIVKTEIVDDALMVFMQDKVGQPLQTPVGIAPRRIVSEEGRITVQSDIDPSPQLDEAIDACIADRSQCVDHLY